MCGALVMSGVAMEVAGSSRPASGSEHLISHAYDSHRGATPSLHGLQVGVATPGDHLAAGQPRARDRRQGARRRPASSAFMTENRLDRAAFLEAVHLAPTIKPGYHTVLSQPGAVERLQAHLKNDPSWDRYLD